MKKDTHHTPQETPDVSDIHNPDVAHEESDVNVSMLFKFIFYLFVSTVVILVAMKFMMGYFEQRELAEELPPASRVNPPGTRRLPPMPRLQGAPGSELLPLDEAKKFQAEQQAAINGYAWVDRPTGVVRIPIEEAKRIALERGFQTKVVAPPVSAATPAAAPSATPAAKPASVKAAGAGR